MAIETSTVIDIRYNAVALGGAIPDYPAPALKVYGDIVANNITAALDKLT